MWLIGWSGAVVRPSIPPRHALAELYRVEVHLGFHRRCRCDKVKHIAQRTVSHKSRVGVSRHAFVLEDDIDIVHSLENCSYLLEVVIVEEEFIVTPRDEVVFVRRVIFPHFAAFYIVAYFLCRLHEHFPAVCSRLHAAFDQCSNCLRLRVICPYNELGSESLDLHLPGCYDERNLFIAGDFEIGFATQVNVAVLHIEIRCITDRTARVEHDLGPVRE